MRAKSLTTVPDSTSQKFMLLGQLNRKSSTDEGRFAAIFIDFATMGKRHCEEKDFDRWYARTAKGKECLMGHKQWYRRRKPNADCYVGDKFKEPIEHEENCECTDDDYEWCVLNLERLYWNSPPLFVVTTTTCVKETSVSPQDQNLSLPVSVPTTGKEHTWVLRDIGSSPATPAFLRSQEPRMRRWRRTARKVSGHLVAPLALTYGAFYQLNLRKDKLLIRQ